MDRLYVHDVSRYHRKSATQPQPKSVQMDTPDECKSDPKERRKQFACDRQSCQPELSSHLLEVHGSQGLKLHPKQHVCERLANREAVGLPGMPNPEHQTISTLRG